MKNILTGLALALISAQSLATNCWPSNVGGSGTGFEWVLTPEVVGPTVTNPDGSQTGTGILPTYVAYWKCISPYDPPRVRAIWCPKEFLTGDCLINGVEVAIASRSLDRLAEAWAKNIQHNYANDEVEKVLRAVEASLPPVPIWKVAKNGTSTTRPAYPILNGVRSTTSTARATVGATCDCSVRSVEGKSTYCAWEPTKTTVALCTRVQ